MKSLKTSAVLIGTQIVFIPLYSHTSNGYLKALKDTKRDIALACGVPPRLLNPKKDK